MTALEHVGFYGDGSAGSRDALAAAVELSRRNGATLTVLGAIGRPEGRVLQASIRERLLQVIRQERESLVRSLAAEAQRTLPPDRVRPVLLEGEVPWHSVAAWAGEYRPDLLVVKSRGGEGGFDSVSKHLFRKCAVPVWSIQPGRPPFPRIALAAVDPGEAGSGRRALARRVLEVATAIAGNGPLELHVAHAWRLHGEALFRRELGEANARLFAERVHDEARQAVDELLAESPFAQVAAVHLPNGDPAPAIPALAEELDADLVLLGSAGRTGLAGFLIGGTAEAVIERIARSVVIVKPPGFVSPVKASKNERAVPLSASG